MAEPPPPLLPNEPFKPPLIGLKPLQRQILQYLGQGGTPSINAISTDLDIWRYSAQRSLKLMKSRRLVEDEWVYAAPTVVPRIKAHTFHITDRGRKELKLLQSLGEPLKAYPVEYCILMCLRHGDLVTIDPIAKMLDKDRGHVGRVIKSLHRAGLVDCLYSKTRASFGQDMITHRYRIADLGRRVLEAGPNAYLRKIRQHPSLSG